MARLDLSNPDNGHVCRFVRGVRMLGYMTPKRRGEVRFFWPAPESLERVADWVAGKIGLKELLG